MDEATLLNPNGVLLPEFEQQLFMARKTKPLWVQLVKVSQEIETLEGREIVAPGDYLCRGIQGELWPQKAKRLFENHQPTGHVSDDGWHEFAPKSDAAPVQAARVNVPFAVNSHWGKLNGKANDYFVRSSCDSTDVWIVDKAIFEASYEQVLRKSNEDTGG
ncbi:MAG: hypothetical protein SFV81_24050 [Pirellulaceae bacterium]|nr:hypothetical protein [Pirellulaceae bacterium]